MIEDEFSYLFYDSVDSLEKQELRRNYRCFPKAASSESCGRSCKWA